MRRPLEYGQYVSLAYSDALITAGVEASVGTVGDSYDNALAETVNGLYKAELIHRQRTWPSATAPRPRSKPPILTTGRPRRRPSNHGTKPRALQSLVLVWLVVLQGIAPTLLVTGRSVARVDMPLWSAQPQNSAPFQVI